MAIVSPGAKERFKNSAATFTAICFLSLCMFHLEYWFDQEALCVTVVPAKSEHFADYPAAWLSLDVHHEIYRFSDLGLCVGEGRLSVAANDKVGKSMESLLRGIGVNCRQRTGVAGIEGIK
jgi:hypothetical protein